MLKGDKLISNCAVCRSSLSVYDWIEIQDIKDYNFLTTKINKLKETYESAITRRNKKRFQETIYVVTNENNIDTLKQHGFENLISFQELKNLQIADYVTFIFACPPQDDEINYCLIKWANSDDISIQLYLIYANCEDATKTKELFMTKEPKRRPKII
jgi:hypothetical protein